MLSRLIKLYGGAGSSSVLSFKTKYETNGSGKAFELPFVRYAAFDWFFG